MAHTCPTCGGFLGEAAPIDKVIRAVTTPQVRYALAVLANPVGEWVSVEAIEKELWSKHNPRLDTIISRRSVSVMICKAQRTLADFGWCILSNRSGFYRLAPMEASA